MRSASSGAFLAILFCLSGAASDQPHAVNPGLRQPVKLPAFLKGKTLYVAESAGSAGNSSVRTATSWTSPNPAWLPPGINFNRELKMTDIDLERDATEIVRKALVESLQSGGGLAQDEATAGYSISFKLYRFGLAEATWREYYAKLEMWVSVKNRRTGDITDIFALGTAVKGKEDKPDKAREAIQSSLETALARGVANFLYNAKLASAVAPELTPSQAATPGPATIEIRRFRIAETAVFPSEFLDFLYTQLLEKLKAAQPTYTVVGENEVADSLGGERLVLEGTMLRAKGAWYRGAGEKKLTAEITLRRAANETVLEKQIEAGPNIWTRTSWPDENELWSAPALADRIVKEIRDVRRK